MTAVTFAFPNGFSSAMAYYLRNWLTNTTLVSDLKLVGYWWRYEGRCNLHFFRLVSLVAKIHFGGWNSVKTDSLLLLLSLLSSFWIGEEYRNLNGRKRLNIRFEINSEKLLLQWNLKNSREILWASGRLFTHLYTRGQIGQTERLPAVLPCFFDDCCSSLQLSPLLSALSLSQQWQYQNTALSLVNVDCNS